jgi:hypothetical protein
LNVFTDEIIPKIMMTAPHHQSGLGKKSKMKRISIKIAVLIITPDMRAEICAGAAG